MYCKKGNSLMEKNDIIRNKGRETRNKRKTQTAKTFEIKLDKSKISKEKLDNLQRLFLEGKWFTNYIISKGITNLVPYKDYKVDKVSVKVKDKYEEEETLKSFKRLGNKAGLAFMKENF